MILSFKNFYNVNPVRKQWLKNILDRDDKKYIKHIGFNYPVQSRSPFFRDLYKKYVNYTMELFGGYTMSPSNSDTLWCYRSTQKDFNSIWHDHTRTSTINGVYYLQVNGGDSISFKNDEVTNYEPDEGELIIFPNYLEHKPEPPTGRKVRYCLNLEIKTNEPVHELFGRLN